MPKVGIDIGLTVCTDPDRRNFARLGMSINDIDTAGDIDEQANEGISTAVKLFDMANSGLEEAIIDALGDLTDITEGGVRADVAKIKNDILPKVITEMKRQKAKIEGIGGECNEGAN